MIFSHSDDWIPIMLLITRFGVAQAFCLAYLAVILLFPTILNATALGICNLAARIATIMAPVVAEVRLPINLLILFIIISIALLSSQCIIVPKN